MASTSSKEKAHYATSDDLHKNVTEFKEISDELLTAIEARNRKERLVFGFMMIVLLLLICSLVYIIGYGIIQLYNSGYLPISSAFLFGFGYSYIMGKDKEA